jgi:hypothetical protein
MPTLVTTHDTLDIRTSHKHTVLIQTLYFPVLLPLNQNETNLTSYDLRRTTPYEHTVMFGPAPAGQYTGRGSYQYN